MRDVLMWLNCKWHIQMFFIENVYNSAEYIRALVSFWLNCQELENKMISFERNARIANDT